MATPKTSVLHAAAVGLRARRVDGPAGGVGVEAAGDVVGALGGRLAAGRVVVDRAVVGDPALLVDADTATSADFAINATNLVLSEKENGTNYNPAGASHSEFGQDADMSDIYQSEIRGLIAIEDDFTFQNRALIRGQVLVGDDIANSSGELEIEYNPEALLNPPPGFLAPYSHQRRPASAIKAVLP